MSRAGLWMLYGAVGYTGAPLAEACLAAGVHYLDVGNELQVFRTLYDLDQRAQQAGVTIMPGVGFGVVATKWLALHVGGAAILEIPTRAATAQQGPSVAATRQDNMPYGGRIRQVGHLEPCPLGSGTIAIMLPGGLCPVMPLPTGDLEAAFQATGAADITAYGAVPGGPAAADPQDSDPVPATYRSFGWARATGPDGAAAAAWLQVGESYAFTAASMRAVEETLTRALHGAVSLAAAFGADFALTIPGTSRTDTVCAEAPLAGRP
jgi:hypothetical protein